MKDSAVIVAVIAILTMFLCVNVVYAQIYKWRDSSGKLHISNNPPPAGIAPEFQQGEGQTWNPSMGGTASVPKTSDSTTSAFCREKWPTDYRMQNHCTEQESKGAEILVRFARKNGLITGYSSVMELLTSVQRRLEHNDPAAIIIAKCMIDWKGETVDRYDWRMIGHCIEQQEAAYQAQRR